MKPTNNTVQDSSLNPELLSAVDDIHQRFNDGERVSIDDYVKRFPQHEATLRQVFHTFQFMTAYGDSVVGASPTSSNPQEHTKQIGEFTVIRQVGRGGMGVVYEAYQGILDRRVALKILPLAGLADRRQIQRFKNEARAAATLHHTNIVPILSVGSDQGIHYYAMQFIDGPSFAEVIRELNGGSAAPTPLDAPAASMSPSLVKSNDTAELDAQWESSAESDTLRVIHAGISTSRETSPREYFRTVAKWIERAADGLAHAHENGVLHRDIKPGNLMIDASGHVWITDFGLARLEADASLTATGEMLGTLRYMAPEQVSGQKVLVDHRADIYSLGLTLYELLTLTPAFPGNDRTALLKKIASFDPTPPRQLNARIPQELETIVLKATEKNPADRYMSAQELALDLARFLDNRPVLAKRPSLATRLTKWSLRHRTIVSTVAASLLVALIASSVVFGNANRRIRSALDTLQDKNDELRLANERSAKTLNLARQAIDDVYVEFANKWVGEQSDLSPLQRDFLVSAAEIYTELCTEFLNDYELLLRTIEAQVGAANITAYLGDPDKANGWFKQAFDSMDYLNATKPMEVGLLAMIARGKADYGHHNFFNWDGRHTKVSSKQWLNNEVLPAVYALAGYLEQAPDDHYAIEALAYAQASLFSHSSGISDHDWAKLKGQINRNVDRLKTQHPSPQILSQLSDTLQKAITLELTKNREKISSEDLERLIADAELAIELAQQAYETSPTREIQQRLAWAHSQLANIQRTTSLKLLPEAVEGFRKAIQHTSGLAQQFPSRVEYWNDLCGQYMVLSDTHHEMGLPSARPEWLEYHEAYCEQHLREGLSLEFPDVARDFALVFKSNILTSLATFHGRMNDAKQSFECVCQTQLRISQFSRVAGVFAIGWSQVAGWLIRVEGCFQLRKIASL